MIRTIIAASFILCALLPTAFSGQLFADYLEQWKDPNIDVSAVQTCWITGGVFSEVEQGNPVKGHKCSTKEQIWTANDNHAMEFCESRFPYHIISATVSSMGGGLPATECVFQVNLACDHGWWQIHNKCYRVVEKEVTNVQYTFDEAKHICETFEKSRNHQEMQLAEFYSSNLALYLTHLGFGEAWVIIPDWSPYYTNGVGEGGVLVVDEAWRHEVKEGTPVLPEEGRTYRALCQYTPAMTLAESFWIAKIYNDAYPLIISDLGVVIEAGGFHTITSKGVDKYDSSNIAQTCKAIGKLLQMEAYPQSSLKSEFDIIYPFLKSHRYYLTGAVKQDGKEITGYRDNSDDGNSHQTYTSTIIGDFSNAHSLSFHTEKRVPTMAGMRAPALCSVHSFKYEPMPCEPAKPNWHLIEFKRTKNTICHYINSKKLVYRDEAHHICQSQDMQLSGFESQAELTAVANKMMATQPPNITKVDPYHGGHYWLGGVVPCKSACIINPYPTRSLASWNPAVSINNQFLHDKGRRSTANPWAESNNSWISMRADLAELHTHDNTNQSWVACAAFTRSKAVKIEPKIVRL